MRTNIDHLLTQTRDALLDWSRDSLQAECVRERVKADIAFALAKEADDLRRRVADLERAEITDSDRTPSQGGIPIGTEVATSTPHSSARRRIRDYPKYLRRGDALVKVGLSKDKKSEYKHIVPAVEFQRVVALVVSAGKDGNEFTAETFLKGFEGATYHAYVVLAFLRQTKSLTQVRRGAYRIVVKSLEVAVGDIWKTLPEESHE